MKKIIFPVFLLVSMVLILPLSADDEKQDKKSEPAQSEQPNENSEKSPEKKGTEETKSRKERISDVLNGEYTLTDPRNGELRTTRDPYHPWTPAGNKDSWEKQAESIREQILVSNGLWPMPPIHPIKAEIFGKIDRGDYTVEKVYFSSHPGHYVTGNLYKPARIEGKVPGILCPHGHWRDGRFYELEEAEAKKQIEIGAEKLMSGATSPVQARMVHLARMGCVVFHYDMVGYADSKQIGHSAGFLSADAGLRLQNFMGLQTFNSLRALDFLISQPEVDPNRIAVTGSSGGGTQTFLVCALDDRPKAAFPAVMVSTGMQGGCVCENASYLRQGVNNIAFAALFAPKPMAMSGADDWTIEIETKGYPELQQIYGYYDKRDDVYAKAYPQFKHNYNLVARTMMYEWMKKYLNMDNEVSTEEKEFEPLTTEEMSVFSDGRKLPEDAVSSEKLREYLTKTSDESYQKLLPKTKEQVEAYREVIATAARVMLGPGVPNGDLLVSEAQEPVQIGDEMVYVKGGVTRTDTKAQILFGILFPQSAFQNTVDIWLEDEGKSCLFDENDQVRPEIKELVKGGHAVLSIDLCLTGEWLADSTLGEKYKVSDKYHGYTYCFNRPILSRRVQDIVTIIAGLYKLDFVYEINLTGKGKAGVAALLARSLADNYVTRTVVDIDGFSFNGVESVNDELFLPGALKYGGIGGLGALAAPYHLFLAGTKGVPEKELSPLRKVYQVSEGKLIEKEDSLTRKEMADILLGR